MNRQISLDKGKTYMSAEEAINEIGHRGLWTVVFDRMDGKVCERLNRELAPCTEEEFLKAYLQAADEDLILG